MTTAVMRGTQNKRLTVCFREDPPDSEVNFGEVAFPQRNALEKQVLYQGTALAVPKCKVITGL